MTKSRKYIYDKYVDDVLSDRILTGKWAKLAVQRQHDDVLTLADQGRYVWEPERAEIIAEIHESSPHPEGRWNTSHLELLGFQAFLYYSIFGWVHRPGYIDEDGDDLSGYRRYRKALFYIARKNAKSTLGAVVGNTMLAFDNEPGARVVSAATSAIQAAYIFDAAKKMVKNQPKFGKKGIQAYQYSITHAKTDSTFKALSSERSGNHDGDNVSAGLVDELHAHKDRKMYDVITSSVQARKQSLLLFTSTAGFNLTGIGYEEQKYVEDILEKRVSDDNYFGIVYALDKEDDWQDEAVWIKANPSLGKIVKTDTIRKAVKEAQVKVSAQPGVKTKFMNIWCNSDYQWLDSNAWAACKDTSFSEEDFLGEDCIIGFDMSSKIDITSVCAIFARMIDGKRHFYCFSWNFLPEETVLKSSVNKYAEWSEDGTLIMCPGARIDPDMIETLIRDLAEKYNVLEVTRDPWGNDSITAHLIDDGIEMVDVAQNARLLSDPMKELEACVVSRTFHHTGNEVLTWCVENVVVHEDANENILPKREKTRPDNKIDAAAALITAMSRALTLEGEVDSLDHLLDNPISF